MKRAKIYKVNFDVHKRSVWLVYTQDVPGYAKRLLKKMPKLKEADEDDPTPDDLALTYYNLAEYEIAFILLPTGSGAPLLAHEAIHFVDEMMSFFGLEGTEFRGHAVQYIMEHVYKP